MTARYSSQVDAWRGRIDNGTVGLRDFDEGLVETLGGVLNSGQPPGYFVNIAGVVPPANLPGVPIVFSFPEDRFGLYRHSSLLVRRESIDPALQRWGYGGIQWAGPAPGADRVERGDRTGWTALAKRRQAMPYDISYSIQTYARDRTTSNAMLDHILRRFPPYGVLYLTDSRGDMRSYSTLSEGISPMDDALDIGDRVVGFTISVRVEGELDLSDAEIAKTVASRTIKLEPR